MSTISSEEIISILKEKIENYDAMCQEQETGKVISVGDGIATIYGIDHAMYGEIVTFENGEKGMVQDIRQDTIGCILFGKDTGIKEGTRVVRTKKKAGIPVGEGFVGRVINALGEPIDGKGAVEEDDYYPVEREAPGIIERKSVSVPMETGILSIDSMFPIGRGQRELIIGDRQTGKTAIATDTILNQKGKDVICVYVAIGQKASTIAKLVNTLTKHDAMDYTIIVSATASDCAPLPYTMICPNMRLHTVPCPCCWSVLRDVKLIRVTYSICIPDCWNVPAGCAMKKAADLSQHCRSSRHRRVTCRPISRQTLFPSQTVRSSWKVICSSPVCVRP